MANGLYPGKAKKPIGFFYRCRSKIDGAPIVVIFTGFSRGSKNSKTGKMIQTWILREDINPMWALKCGADWSICGNCKQRPFVGGKCYVTVARAPLTIYKAFLRGRYAPLELNKLEAFNGKFLRIGSYGDPAAIPIAIWEILISRGELSGWTGYSHQWQWKRFQGFKYFLMASVDSQSEQRMASDIGWKTFRARQCGEAILPGEMVCPASAEAGHKCTCSTCQGCNGQRGNKVIFLHGFRAKERMVAQ